MLYLHFWTLPLGHSTPVYVLAGDNKPRTWRIRGWTRFQEDGLKRPPSLWTMHSVRIKLMPPPRSIIHHRGNRLRPSHYKFCCSTSRRSDLAIHVIARISAGSYFKSHQSLLSRSFEQIFVILSPSHLLLIWKVPCSCFEDAWKNWLVLGPRGETRNGCVCSSLQHIFRTNLSLTSFLVSKPISISLQTNWNLHHLISNLKQPVQL